MNKQLAMPNFQYRMHKNQNIMLAIIIANAQKILTILNPVEMFSLLGCII
jgi:hypothetical protein